MVEQTKTAKTSETASEKKADEKKAETSIALGQIDSKVKPLRTYRPDETDEGALRREAARLGTELKAHTVKGDSLVARVTKLAADVVDMMLKRTNDRSQVTEARVRNWLRATMGYGAAKDNDDPTKGTVVSAAERNPTLDNAIKTAVRAAALYHNAFNGCDIRWYKDNKIVPADTKGAMPRVAMPFKNWLPEFTIVGTDTPKANDDTRYTPLPSWAIDAQYELMIAQAQGRNAELDPKTGRVKRAKSTGASDNGRAEGAGKGSDAFQEMEKIVNAAASAKDTRLSLGTFENAAAVIVGGLRNASKNADIFKNEKVRNVLAELYELLDRILEDEGKSRETGETAKKEDRKTA